VRARNLDMLNIYHSENILKKNILAQEPRNVYYGVIYDKNYVFEE